jgi:hypothetical protein
MHKETIAQQATAAKNQSTLNKKERSIDQYDIKGK